jgi:hypothetical protein
LPRENDEIFHPSAHNYFFTFRGHRAGPYDDFTRRILFEFVTYRTLKYLRIASPRM